MDWKYLFTSFEGRIGRQQMWMGVIVICAVSFIASALDWILGTISLDRGFGIIGGIVSLISIYPSLALYAKRWHDRGKSGWWSLIILVPLIGVIWWFVECGCLRGTEGPNQYGSDPLAA
ncbi:MAG: DUF805 domain-containing protein [Alphaproteobacteria bacterium]|nr:DUF805 domain-containing protein [Alphaproteobacteria bacterium]